MSKKHVKRENVLYKSFQVELKSSDPIKTDTGEYGIIGGYASTYGNVDRGGDVVMPGAFTASLERYRKSNDRQIRMHNQHFNLIGGFPINKVKDDEYGLYVEGEINLGTQVGRETYALVKQGVLTDLSIGYSVLEDEVDIDGHTLLKKLELWEVSTVSEPMNPDANITQVKSVTSEDINDFDCMKDVEKFLKNPEPLSGNARKTLISKIKSFSRDAEDGEKAERDAHEKKEKESSANLEVLSKLDEITNLFTEDN